jgi:hypothetical protein
MQLTITLVAGVKKKAGYGGRNLVITDTGLAASVALRLYMPGQNDEEINEASRGFGVSLNAGRFFDVELLSTVNTTVKLIVSDNDIKFNVFDGATINAQLLNLPIPVSNDRGTPGNLLFVSGVSISDAPATSCTNAAPVAVTSAGQVIAAADATRREVRFINLGPDPVAIGPAGMTWAQRVVVLQVDDVWIETRGANLAWSAICDATKTASVGRQGVLA